LALIDTRAAADTDDARAVRMKAAEDVEREGPEPFIERQIPRLLGETTRRNRPDLVERTRRMMTKMTVHGIAAVQRGMAARPDSTPTLPTIAVPTLVVCGDEDALATPAEMLAMQHQIPGSTFYVIPQAGHYSVFERSEDATRILRQFFEALRS
jgi:pimeloyl-ACP methyl ester carboxylesterase